LFCEESPDQGCCQPFQKLVDFSDVIALRGEAEVVGDHILGEEFLTSLELRGQRLEKLVDLKTS
jgi:hypothetical protein